MHKIKVCGKAGNKVKIFYFLTDEISNIRTASLMFKTESLNPPYTVCSTEKVSLEIKTAMCGCYRRSLLDCNKYVLIRHFIWKPGSRAVVFLC